MKDQDGIDASSEKQTREAAFDVMIQRGLDDSGTGRTIAHEKLNHHIESWSGNTGGSST